MKKNIIPIRYTGQHFTVNKNLIKKMIIESEITESDLVIDIGAGTGNITIELAKIGCKVIAIENDFRLFKQLEERLNSYKNVIVVHSDIENYIFPKKDFKVVSNIPFLKTSSILQFLMKESIQSFSGGCLIVQKEIAYKLTKNKTNSANNIFYQFFFSIELIKIIKPTNFYPPPKIDCGILQIKKRSENLDLMHNGIKIHSFLERILSKPHLQLIVALRKYFRKHQIEHLMYKNEIPQDLRIERVKVHEWELILREWIKITKSN